MNNLQTILNELGAREIKSSYDMLSSVKDSSSKIKEKELFDILIKSGNIVEYTHNLKLKFKRRRFNKDEIKKKMLSEFKKDYKIIKDHLSGKKRVPTLEKISDRFLTNLHRNIEKLIDRYSIKSIRKYIKSKSKGPGSSRQSNEKEIKFILNSFLEKSKLRSVIRLNTVATSINKLQISDLKRDSRFVWKADRGELFSFEAKKGSIKSLNTKTGLLFAEIEKPFANTKKKDIDKKFTPKN